MGIDFKADLVNTRDIIGRIEEIELEYTDDEGELADQDTWTPEDRLEWRGLSEIIEEVGDEARHGVTLINEGYFTEYARDWYADTYGNTYQRYDSRQYKRVDVTWDELMSTLPFSCIDWERVAQEVYSDYSQLEIDGTTYLYQG